MILAMTLSPHRLIASSPHRLLPLSTLLKSLQLEIASGLYKSQGVRCDPIVHIAFQLSGNQLQSLPEEIGHDAAIGNILLGVCAVAL